jgi:hypothetical protein
MGRSGRSSGVAEDRLSYAMGRLSRGTYMPTQSQRALGFAGDGGPEIAYESGWGCSCGAIRDDGTTASRYHAAGCEHAMSGDEQAEYRTAGVLGDIAGQEWRDASGQVSLDQHGQAMTLSDHFEALTGQRVARSPFEGLNRRELSAPQRLAGFGEYGEPGDPGEALTPASARYLGAVKAALGLPDQAAAREQVRHQGIARMVNRPTQRYRTVGEALDYGPETMQERRERVPPAGRLRPGGDRLERRLLATGRAGRVHAVLSREADRCRVTW